MTPHERLIVFGAQDVGDEPATHGEELRDQFEGTIVQNHILLRWHFVVFVSSCKDGGERLVIKIGMNRIKSFTWKSDAAFDWLVGEESNANNKAGQGHVLLGDLHARSRGGTEIFHHPALLQALKLVIQLMEFG